MARVTAEADPTCITQKPLPFVVAAALVVSSGCRSRGNGNSGNPGGPSPVPNSSEPIQITAFIINTYGGGSELGTPMPPEGVPTGTRVLVSVLFNGPEAGRKVNSTFTATLNGKLVVQETTEHTLFYVGPTGVQFAFWVTEVGEHRVRVLIDDGRQTQSREGSFMVRTP